MRKKLNFDLLAKEILFVLQRNELFPDNFGVSLTLTHKDFEIISAQNPNHHPDLVIITGFESGNVHWDIQIMWHRAPEDLAPGDILPSPPN
jgi:hypothetical protein